MRIVDTTLYRSQYPHMALNMATWNREMLPIKSRAKRILLSSFSVGYICIPLLRTGAAVCSRTRSLGLITNRGRHTVDVIRITTRAQIYKEVCGTLLPHAH